MNIRTASKALRHAAGNYAETWTPTAEGGAIVNYADGHRSEITAADIRRAARCPEVIDADRFACEC